MTAHGEALDIEFPGTAILETVVLFAGVVMLAATVSVATDPVARTLAEWTAPLAQHVENGR